MILLEILCTTTILLFGLAALFFALKNANQKHTIARLRNTLSITILDHEKIVRDLSNAVAYEEALNEALVLELSEFTNSVDIESCITEMDRLEVKDLLEEMDDENNLFM